MNQPRTDFKNKKIAVIGEGLEGKSSASFLEKHGAKVTILDKKQDDEYLEDLDRFDLLVRSPGVHLSLLKKHVSQEKITSQTKLFFDLCPAKIIGVTGTKGKGTTSSLIYEMLKAQGFDAYLGGNIGIPPFDFLDKLNKNSWVVLELSSFQLQDMTKSPHISVLLMVTSEHLEDWGDRNRHESLEEYIESKRNILNHQSSSDFAVINRDYPASNESDIATSGKVYFVSREREVEEGCFTRKGKIVLRVSGVSKVPKGNSSPSDTSDTFDTFNTFRDIDVIDTKDLLLRGAHNHENVCAATMAAYLAGVKLGTITGVLKTFKGLEHRLELVCIINGVEYYNDSFSTIPETTIAAIKSFKNPEILLLGGSSKNSDFKELGKVIGFSENIKAIIGIGEEWDRIKAELKFDYSSSEQSESRSSGSDSSRQARTITPLIVEGATNMNQIVQAASKIALPGDVVLLSPACASFDKFKNYKDRGLQFKEEVKKLVKS